MKNLKRMLCVVLVCVLIGSLLPMTAAAEDIKITSMEFSVENLKVGEKGTALKAHVAGDQPITLNNLATLRYDDAGEPGLLVKSDLLQEGTVYWLCINPVVKSGYSLTPYIMLRKESWTINGLPYGMAIDKVVQSGNQVRFRLTPLQKEVDTLSITGVPAPKYGQKVKEYYSVWTDVFDKGTGKVNGVAYAGNWLFEGIFLAEGAILNEGKKEINPETQISADTYYMWYRFECVPERVFTDDIQVSVEGAISAEAEFYGDALLVYAKYEVPEPVFTEQPAGGDVAPGETKTVKWATNFTPVKNVLFKVKTHPVDGMKITSENLGTATTAEVGAGYEYYIIRSYYSDSGYVNSNEFYVNELETCTVTFDSDGGSAVAAQTVEDGKTATKPADPTKEGYAFQGWYLGSTAYDFSKPVTGNITLKAKWEKKSGHTHTYTDIVDGTCNGCGAHREEVETRKVVHMFRMYNPNTGEHFYTGSTVERDNLIGHGWQYEGVGFTFPANTGAPVYRLFHEPTGEHLYTMSKEEKEMLEAKGWNYEGIAFNSAYDTEAVQHRLHNPNADVGAYHFTFSLEEKANLIAAGWEYQGIGWYSCWK